MILPDAANRINKIVNKYCIKIMTPLVLNSSYLSLLKIILIAIIVYSAKLNKGFSNFIFPFLVL